MSLLHVDRVSKHFGPHQVLREVAFSIERGEILCLLGASGSGKTTLLRLIAGLDRVDAGRIVLGERIVDAPGSSMVPAEQRQLGMVFQDFALWPHLTALENVALPLRARRVRNARLQALKMLERVGLGTVQSRKPYELSGGQQQRVALARALAVRPRLLLCDEPLSSLDAALREDLRDLIGSVVREHGLSALYITHDQREAFALADRVGVIDGGGLLQIDTPRALWQRPGCEAVARLTHAFGPWKAHVADGRLHAPWGACPMPAALSRTTPDADMKLYLRAPALQPPSAPNAPWTARARVLGSLVIGDGVELRCDLHGVPLRVPAREPVSPGAEITLAIVPSHALLYADQAGHSGTTRP